MSRTTHTVKLGLCAVGATVAALASPAATAISLFGVTVDLSRPADKDWATYAAAEDATDRLVAKSAVYIAETLTDRKHATELKEQFDALNAITDPKERDAKFATLVADLQAQIATESKSDEVQQQLSKADERTQRAFARGLYNLALGLGKGVSASKSAAAVTSDVKVNPTNIKYGVMLAESSTTMSKIVKNGSAILDNSRKLASAAHITIDEPVADAIAIDTPPMAMELDDFNQPADPTSTASAALAAPAAETAAAAAVPVSLPVNAPASNQEKP